MTAHLAESPHVDETPPYGDDEAPPGDDNVRALPTRGPTPHLEAEQALLGALLHSPALHETAAQIVSTDDFDELSHQVLWDAMVAVFERDAVPPDRALVTSELHRTGNLTKVAQLLPELITNGANPIAIKAYARDVAWHASRRYAATQARFLVYAIESADHPEVWAPALDRAYEALDRTMDYRGPSRAQALHADLTWLLSGQAPVVEPPTYVRRTAGGALFYPGRVNGIYGDPESAKTWIAQVGIVEALTAGQSAGFIDVDHNGPQLTTERLLLLGATNTQLANPHLFRYHEPTDGPELLATITSWATWKPAYVVLDSIGEMMPMLGAKSVDNDELSAALRALTQPLIKQGSCVVTVDHLPKSPEARSSGYAIGGTAKKRAIDGTLIHAETKISPAPNAIGRIILRIEKDRPGRLRAICYGKYIGTFTLDSTNPDTITVAIDSETAAAPGDDHSFRPTMYMERVSRYVEENPGASKNLIELSVKGAAKHKRQALELLILESYIEVVKGLRGSQEHHPVKPYREADETHE